MITPKKRSEFERNIDLLAEQIETGNFQMVPDKRLINGLMNAKMLPNKRTNFLTIDESTRLLANSISNFSRMDMKKK